MYEDRTEKDALIRENLSLKIKVQEMYALIRDTVDALAPVQVETVDKWVVKLQCRGVFNQILFRLQNDFRHHSQRTENERFKNGTWLDPV